MRKIYLDNAATTALDVAVLEEMLPYMQSVYGNPSSIHGFGRQARTLIEKSRRKVADLLHVSPSEIFFTSGGTESDNMVLISNVLDNEVKHIITSPIEHHAVLHTAQYIQKKSWATLSYVSLDERGGVDLSHLHELCSKNPKSLVSLMHANNEIGNLLELSEVAAICKDYGCVFHSDTVQTMGHVEIDLNKTGIDYVVGSGHKFHGPKGIGFLYAKGLVHPIMHGGAQERNVRGGTENLHAIVGLAKALELSFSNAEKSRQHIKHLKANLISRLKTEIPELVYNGYCDDPSKSLDKIVSITLPKSQSSDLILFNMDIEGIYVSGGSACTSGSLIGSHVLNEIHPGSENAVIRISFSKYNTIEDNDEFIRVLKKIYV